MSWDESYNIVMPLFWFIFPSIFGSCTAMDFYSRNLFLEFPTTVFLWIVIFLHLQTTTF
jgi:hypothetical protein